MVSEKVINTLDYYYYNYYYEMHTCSNVEFQYHLINAHINNYSIT